MEMDMPRCFPIRAPDGMSMLLRPVLAVRKSHRSHGHLLTASSGDLYSKLLNTIGADDAGARAVALPLVMFTPIHRHSRVLCKKTVKFHRTEVCGRDHRDRMKMHGTAKLHTRSYFHLSSAIVS